MAAGIGSLRDRLTFRQLAATVLAGLSVPLTLLGARLHWRWVLVAVLFAAIYYCMLYRKTAEKPLTELTVSVYGTAGKRMLGLIAVWLVWLAGYLADKSALSFPQTAGLPLTGLAVLALAAWAAKDGIRTVVRCGTILLLLLAVLYATVLTFSTPQVRTKWLSPAGDWTQAVFFFPLLTLPTLVLYFKPEPDGTSLIPWLTAGAVLTLAASVITAGCLSAPVAAREMSFYTLARSVSLFGTVLRFEALISAACLAGFFCLIGFVLCTAREILMFLEWKREMLWIFLLAVLAAVLSSRLSPSFFSAGAGIFCAVFPLITQGIGGRKKL